MAFHCLRSFFYFFLLAAAPVVALPDLIKASNVCSTCCTLTLLWLESWLTCARKSCCFVHNCKLKICTCKNKLRITRVLLRACVRLASGGAILRAFQVVSALHIITHSFIYKRTPACPEGKQGGWSFCHISCLPSSRISEPQPVAAWPRNPQ